MNPLGFVTKLGNAWPRDKAIPQEMLEVYLEKLFRFTDAQLDQIFDKLVESCKFFPKIADIFEAARDLNLLETPQHKSAGPRTWEKTGCNLCEGEGLLQVMMLTEYERGEGDFRTGKKTVKFSDLGPYFSGKWTGYRYEEGAASYVFRCSCNAGDAPELPKAYRKWNQGRYQRHEAIVSAGKPQEKPTGFQQVSKLWESEEIPF